MGPFKSSWDAVASPFGTRELFCHKHPGAPTIPNIEESGKAWLGTLSKFPLPNRSAYQANSIRMKPKSFELFIKWYIYLKYYFKCRRADIFSQTKALPCSFPTRTRPRVSRARPISRFPCAMIFLVPHRSPPHMTARILDGLKL